MSIDYRINTFRNTLFWYLLKKVFRTKRGNYPVIWYMFKVGWESNMTKRRNVDLHKRWITRRCVLVRWGSFQFSSFWWFTRIVGVSPSPLNIYIFFYWAAFRKCRIGNHLEKKIRKENRYSLPKCAWWNVKRYDEFCVQCAK